MRRGIPEDPEDAFNAGLRKALARLERSDAFASEIERLLARAGFQEATVGRVLEHLKQRRLLDDARTAQNSAASNTGRRVVGDSAFKRKLVARGADERDIPAQDDAENIRLLLKIRFPDRDGRAKAARLLLSRGFSDDDVESALNEHFGDPSDLMQ